MTTTAAKLMVVIGGDTSGAEKALSGAARNLDAFASKAQRIGDNLSRWVTLPLLGVGAAATKLAADFDRNMNVLQATSNATAAEMETLRDAAQELGADLTLPGTSAADAAEAMLELSKAGLEVNDTLGASRGVLQMAAAGQISNAKAAEIAANAMNAFGLAGSEATRVADLLAASANASSADIADMADALKMSSAVFAAAGVPIEDLTTAIAEMANAGIQGSDAGTSLKQMMLSLQAPTDKAAKLMQDLGIAVYDSQGAMLPMEQIIGNFENALGGLTQEQRNAALAAIFGSDAVRAANVVLMGGVDAFNEMRDAVTEEGAAAKLAEAQNKGLGGMFDKIKSAAETAMLAGIQPLEDDIIKLADSVSRAFIAFSEFDESTQDMIVKMGLMAIAAGPAIKGIGWIADATNAAIPIALKFGKVFSDVFITNSALAGRTLTSSFISQFGATGVAIGSLTAVVLAGAAVWYTYNKAIKETNDEGQKAVDSAWTEFFADQVEGGKSANEVLDAYNQRLDVVQQKLEEVPWYIRIFIRDQEVLTDNQTELNLALVEASDSYTEYAAAAEKAGLGVETFSEAEYESIKNVEEAAKANEDLSTQLLKTSDSYEGYVQAMTEAGLLLMVITENEYTAARAAQELETETAEAAGGINKLAAVAMAAGDILSGLDSALEAAGWSADEAEAAHNRLAIALGKASMESVQLQSDVDLLTRAFVEGIISADDYGKMMVQARDGTLQLTDAQRAQLQASTDQAAALRDAAAAAQEAAIQQMELAQSLKDATDAQIAQAAINALQQAYEAGQISFSDYLTAVTQVQDAFGLADPKSRALAEGIGLLTQAVIDGTLPADQYDEALKTVIADAQDGQLDIDALTGMFTASGEAASTAGSAMTQGMDEAGKAMEGAAQTAETAANDIAKAFTGIDWVEVGRLIGQGIAQGINESAAEVAAAAAAAAEGASGGVADELEMTSPSRVMMQHGINAMRGFQIGIEDGAESVLDAITAVASTVAGVDWGLQELAMSDWSLPNGNQPIDMVVGGAAEGGSPRHYDNAASTGGGSAQTHLVVNIDGRSVKDIMLRGLNEELS